MASENHWGLYFNSGGHQQVEEFWGNKYAGRFASFMVKA
jgi:hypothetical protein